MRRLFTAFVIAASSATLLAATMASADAQTRKKNPRQITITKRSFLDSGKHPLPGTMNRYVTMDTHYGVRPYHNTFVGSGSSSLPGRFGPFWPN